MPLQNIPNKGFMGIKVKTPAVAGAFSFLLPV
jgi:hypothetical protein